MLMAIPSDVTIFQRSPIYVMTSTAKNAMTSGVYCENGPPLEVADCLNASFPNLFMAGEFGQRMTAMLAKMDQSVNLSLLEYLNSQCRFSGTRSTDSTELDFNAIWE